MVLVLLLVALCPSSFAIILMGKKKRASCFTLTVFLMSCDSQCSVALPLLCNHLDGEEKES